MKKGYPIHILLSWKSWTLFVLVWGESSWKKLLLRLLRLGYWEYPHICISWLISIEWSWLQVCPPDDSVAVPTFISPPSVCAGLKPSHLHQRRGCVLTAYVSGRLSQWLIAGETVSETLVSIFSFTSRLLAAEVLICLWLLVKCCQLPLCPHSAPWGFLLYSRSEGWGGVQHLDNLIKCKHCGHSYWVCGKIPAACVELSFLRGYIRT